MPRWSIMRRWVSFALCAAVLSACATTRPREPALPWDQRLGDLQRSVTWQLDGRAAVALGTQGWQASLNWREMDALAELHLAGPFGIGSLAIKQTPAGLSLNGAPPGDAVLQLQEKLGFDLPLANLRFWLLGVPNPAGPFELSRNDQDRARQLTQDGWTIGYDKYAPVSGDVLPTRVMLSRDDVRVRIVIDQWQWQ